MTETEHADGMSDSLIAAAASSTVSGLFQNRVKTHPDREAITDERVSWTYAELSERVGRLATVFQSHAVKRGDRIAILSENRAEYLEIFIAAARIGAIVACQNTRLADPELQHCLKLADPTLVIASPEHEASIARLLPESFSIVFGADYETRIANVHNMVSMESADTEDALLLLYTSGTTGLPKGALISHRAEIARNMVVAAEFGVAPDDAFVAWSPLYHMGAAEISLGTLMNGGTVIVVNGFQTERLVDIVAERRLGWLLIMPGMAEQFANALEAAQTVPAGIKLCGVMADLVPPLQIARITRLLDAPYANTFGATETGCPPCSSNRIPVGVVPETLAKELSPFCEIRLVDAADNDVEGGAPGELAMRGPTLFSGYWRNAQANDEDFRGGWFHMGDVFVRNPDGTLDFVDRVKYMIKSGGENIYPAEIERVLLAQQGVVDAAVVRQADVRWGEAPVAFVARTEEISADFLLDACRGSLARYKLPKRIIFIEQEEFPRSASGKIQRHALEAMLDSD